MRRALILCSLALLVAVPAAYGQAQRGSVSVTVVDNDGAALPGAAVAIASEETLTRRTGITDERGHVSLVALDPATDYEVVVSLDGFSETRTEGVLVRAGQEAELRVELGLATVAEELIVTAEAPLVDTSKTQAGQDITLQLTESLPTARSYQDYLQLVPGVQATIDGEGNPASRSGVNYRDAFGQVGRSTDNQYYFDGINVTDRTDGIFGANLNTEIIQEQSVITGAIPAEYVGAPGLISNVVTKSGGNQFSGSVNYYFQDDSFVESNDHFPDETFSTYDTAFTLGGPIVRDRAWFYGSYRKLNREDDVVDAQGVFLRSVESDADQGFGKLSWAITDSDLVTGVFLSDPTDISGQRDSTINNAENFAREQGGERFSIGYNRVWGFGSAELGYAEHDGDINTFPIIREPNNVISFRSGDPFTGNEEVLGGAGQDLFVTRSNELVRAATELLFDTGFGDHAVKVGYETGETSLFEDQSFLGDPPATWTSISTRYAGQTIRLCDITGECGDGTGFSTREFGVADDEFAGFRSNLTATQMQTLLGLWDSDGNGVLSNEEINTQMTFGGTAGNPNGQLNYNRDVQVTAGSQLEKSEFDAWYIQDSWQYRRLSVNAGVRVENWEHFASTGQSIIDFEDDVAPRVSVSYDLRGDGRSSVGAYFGRYYDPVRNNMTDFAGSLSGSSIEEQVWVDALGDFVTYRTRGGVTQQDGFFAPSITTPYTDEWQLQYKRDLGRSMAVELNYIDRETSDIMEDYGLVYFDPTVYPGPLDHPDSLFLGTDFLGFDGALPNANFFIANLPSAAFRDWKGVELVFRKRYADHWQLLSSYNYSDAEGNSNSDSNADGAGDVLFLDPRAPGRTGPQPGMVEHLFKIAGSYDWDSGFQVGANYRWNSGVVLNRNEAVLFSRHIPDLVATPFEFAGVEDTWIEEDAIGFFDGSDYGTLDTRVAYLWAINDRFEADFFLDIFNVLDDQQTIRIQNVIAGGDGFQFLEGTTFVDPRRYFLGARLRF